MTLREKLHTHAVVQHLARMREGHLRILIVGPEQLMPTWWNTEAAAKHLLDVLSTYAPGWVFTARGCLQRLKTIWLLTVRHKREEQHNRRPFVPKLQLPNSTTKLTVYRKAGPSAS